jgi:hypothetical protein
VPWWVLIWIKRAPLVFLVFSVTCFSVGLVLFTYSTAQVRFINLLSRGPWTNHCRITEQGNIYYHDSADHFHNLRSRRCIGMVCVRAMDIQSPSRTKMARRCSAGCNQEIPPSACGHNRERGPSMEQCSSERRRRFFETSSFHDYELPWFQWEEKRRQ